MGAALIAIAFAGGLMAFTLTDAFWAFVESMNKSVHYAGSGFGEAYGGNVFFVIYFAFTLVVILASIRLFIRWLRAAVL